MDPNHRISYRLFRDHCVNSEGVFVKDLGLLGRDMQSVVMIDNCRTSYKFQPKNGIECTPFIDNFEDNELMEMTPFLEYLSKKPVALSVLADCVGCPFICRHVERISREPVANRNIQQVVLYRF